MLADSSVLQLGLAVLLVVALYAGAVAAFLKVPHVAVAVTVVVFVLIPSGKVFAGDWVGATKDLIVLGAVSAGILLCVTERRLPDRSILALAGLLLLLYVVDIDGGHGAAWAHGVRVVAEPLGLLLVGLMLPQPQRTFRWAVGSLLVAACLIAVYGLVQQAVGRYTVVGWGYSFGRQVRTAGDHLRSFGTFDDPFAYASFLLYGIGVVLFWLRRGKLAWAVGGLLLAGLAVSYVRTAALVLGAYVALMVVRGGRLSVRALAIAATASVAVLVVAAVVLGATSRTTTIKRNVRTSHGLHTEVVRIRGVVLNGRVSAWKAALGTDPREWALGRGVGRVGTAAERAASTFSPSGPETVDPAIRQADCLRGRLKSCPVDSGYLATVADVGVVGLIVLMALFARLLVLSVRAAVRGHDAGWVALAFLAGLLLDALARASFTGFPTAFIGLLVVGIALAAAREEGDAERPEVRHDLTAAR